MSTGTVSVGRLKQYPHDVLREVANSGEPLEVTSRGVSLGALIAPARPARKTWLTADDLADLAPLDAETGAKWRAQVEALRDTDSLEDPWERHARR